MVMSLDVVVAHDVVWATAADCDGYIFPDFAACRHNSADRFARGEATVKTRERWATPLHLASTGDPSIQRFNIFHTSVIQHHYQITRDGAELQLCLN